MNRRDFLRLRVRGGERVLELSCERLYVRYVDALAAERGRRVPDQGAPRPWEEPGEPPLEVAERGAADLFAELDRRLASTDVLELIDREWLQPPDLRREIEARLVAFRARGGRIE